MLTILNQTPTSRAYRKGNRVFVSQKDKCFRRFEFAKEIAEEIAEDLSAMEQERLDSTVEHVLTVAQKLNANTYYQVAI